jgi:hypothetical protein
MIMSKELSQQVISIIQDISQVSCVYIFHKDNVPYIEWVNKWTKVAGVYTDITSICEALKKAAHDCDHNSVSMSFVKKTDETTNQSLDTSESSFMCTQILKEILLTIDFDQKNSHSRERILSPPTDLVVYLSMFSLFHAQQSITSYGSRFD